MGLAEAAVVKLSLIFSSPLLKPPKFLHLHPKSHIPHRGHSATARYVSADKDKKEKPKKSEAAALKRRTRSERDFDKEQFQQYHGSSSHLPVMLGEVMEVFSPISLHSFIDCTLGAGGHSSANFRNIKSVVREVNEKLLSTGVNGILMDLGVSSMQVDNAERGFSVLCNGPLDMRMDPRASLRAEDILNSWPDAEVGRILRDYGEESNWRSIQNKIVSARLTGGLHSTSQLVDLIRSTTPKTRGGRQGWIKTATRVFQALRIAVNDELASLEESLHGCFDYLAPGGRLVVVSFHSLEDRIVKQTFIDLINSTTIKGDVGEEDDSLTKEAWIRQIVRGRNGTILTKRPITPSEEEEKLNPRCRSAKLRVIQKDR